MTPTNKKAILAAAGLAAVGVYLMYPSDDGGFGGGGGGGILPIIGGAADGAAGGAADSPAGGLAGRLNFPKWFEDDKPTTKKTAAITSTAPTAKSTLSEMFAMLSEAPATASERQYMRVATAGQFTKKQSCHADSDYQSYAASVFGNRPTARSTKQDMFRLMRTANERTTAKKTATDGGRGYSSVSGGGKSGWQQMGYRKPTRPGQPDRY